MQRSSISDFAVQFNSIDGDHTVKQQKNNRFQTHIIVAL